LLKRAAGSIDLVALRPWLGHRRVIFVLSGRLPGRMPGRRSSVNCAGRARQRTGRPLATPSSPPPCDRRSALHLRLTDRSASYRCTIGCDSRLDYARVRDRPVGWSVHHHERLRDIGLRFPPRSAAAPGTICDHGGRRAPVTAVAESAQPCARHPGDRAADCRRPRVGDAKRGDGGDQGPVVVLVVVAACGSSCRSTSTPFHPRHQHAARSWIRRDGIFAALRSSSSPTSASTPCDRRAGGARSQRDMPAGILWLSSPSATLLYMVVAA